MSKYVFYYGIKKLDNKYKHEVIECFSDDAKTLEKWITLFRSFTKLIQETSEEFKNNND